MAKSKGIGDVIAKATKAIGIEPCESCEKRKDLLNRLVPFKNVKYPTEEQKDLIKSNPTDEQLIELYNDIFNSSLDKESFTINIKEAVKNDLNKTL
jgi:hypothetical protein